MSEQTIGEVVADRDRWHGAALTGIAAESMLREERDEARRIAEQYRDDLEELSGGEFEIPWEVKTQ